METNRITGMSAAGGPAAGSQAMKTGEVTTFYSYDSAAVRSLALAHAGRLLAGMRERQAAHGGAVLGIEGRHLAGLHGLRPGGRPSGGR
ncbi:MAG: hypothetical protein EOP92_23950, partial [Lysobacteraceae bacterium]